MEIHNLLGAKSRAELREWLMQNHKKETECWVVVKRGRPVDDDTFWYIDAVEEALCFGWDRQHYKENGGWRNSTEALPTKATKQLVGAKQGKMSQNGTVGADD